MSVAPMDQRAYRALGVTSARRTRWLPQLPSIAEFVPGYDVDPWYGVRVPGGTADAVVRRIHSEPDFDKWGQVARKAGLDLQ
jgi:tripartite-type tricarboxylate transporter receptor subunit TctC